MKGTWKYETVWMKYTANSTFGAVQEGLVWVHNLDKCRGTLCPLHNPSDHAMCSWPVILRFDKNGLIERTCQHGVGHPNPDSLRYLESEMSMMPGTDVITIIDALSVHGCDGCCGG